MIEGELTHLLCSSYGSISAVWQSPNADLQIKEAEEGTLRLIYIIAVAVAFAVAVSDVVASASVSVTGSPVISHRRCCCCRCHCQLV